MEKIQLFLKVLKKIKNLHLLKLLKVKNINLKIRKVI